MSRFRLRYKNTDLEMPLGELVIGRSSECNLALDDGLVSRRHAALRSSADQVTVEDLGSRNGVLVNGVRIEGVRPIGHGDVVTIGGQELVLVDLDARDPRSSHPVTPSKGHEGTLELNVHELAQAIEAEATKQLNALKVLASIADKSLALQRYEDAERILGRQLELILERSRGGAHPERDVFELAIGYALRLAEAKNGQRWIGYVIELHTRTRRLMAAAVIERLHERVRKSRYTDRLAIDEYIRLLDSMTAQLSASDRFLVKRLEALQRVIVA
jgi:pSer/pThr/pTyr-binding forkhead associated (FHA) protein